MSAVPAAKLVGITGIVRRLVLDGALDESAALDALASASQTRKPISNYLRESRLVSSAQLAAANSIEFGMPVFDAFTMDASKSAIKLVTENLLNKHVALPLFKRAGRLYVGISDPKTGVRVDFLAAQRD